MHSTGIYKKTKSRVWTSTGVTSWSTDQTSFQLVDSITVSDLMGFSLLIMLESTGDVSYFYLNPDLVGSWLGQSGQIRIRQGSTDLAIYKFGELMEPNSGFLQIPSSTILCVDTNATSSSLTYYLHAKWSGDSSGNINILNTRMKIIELG